VTTLLHVIRVLVLLVLTLGWAGVAMGQAGRTRSSASDVPAPGVERSPLAPEQADGLTIALVFYDLYGTLGSAEADVRAREEIERAVGIRAEEAFNVVATDVAIGRVRSLDFVAGARYALYPASSDRQVVLVVSVDLGEREEVTEGVLAGRPADFPVLWKDNRSLLRADLALWLGAYADTNPWFGNSGAFTAGSPVALDPPGEGATGWGELALETGVSGAVAVGRLPLYAYGAVSWFTTAAAGHDLFRSDARAAAEIEKGYVGLLLKPERGSGALGVSAGRQNFQLNEGFLISQFAGGANAGPLPGLYLNPRTAFERTLLAKGRLGDISVEGFFLDPNELDFVESDSTYRGVNLQYTPKRGAFGGLVYYDVPRSKTSFATPDGSRVPREGLRTINGRLGSRSAFGVPGLEALGELAHQWHPDADVSASAWYASAGYTLERLSWQPTVTYRYAHFSGDDPATPAFERFDAPLSSGLDNWVQGINFKKVVTNSNLDSHRVRVRVAPWEKANVTLDYFHLSADVPTAGGNRTYGDEVNGALRWSIHPRVYFLAVAGVAFPGPAIEERARGDARNWYTLQASFFLNY
jgi:hypothetical protein